MGIPAAIAGSAALSAGMSYLSGNANKRAAQQAAAAQNKAAAQSIAEQRRQYDQSRADMMPWQTSGREALFTMMDLLGMPTSEYEDTQANPYYQGVKRSSASGGNVPYGQQVSPFIKTMKTRTPVTFDSLLARDQGYQNRFGALNKALERSALAKGDMFSGNFANRLMEENQNFAGNEFANIWNRLAGVSDAGRGATGSTAALGANASGNISNAYFQGAQGAGGPAAAGASMYQDFGNIGNNALNNYAYMSMMNKPQTPSMPRANTGSGYGYGRVPTL